MIAAIEGIPLAGRVVVVARGHKVYKPWAHLPDCDCKPEHTFTCAVCGRRVGWCLGASDNMPAACDFCWRPRP